MMPVLSGWCVQEHRGLGFRCCCWEVVEEARLQPDVQHSVAVDCSVLANGSGGEGSKSCGCGDWTIVKLPAVM